MQELITFHNVEFDGTEQRTVNARDLHSALQIKSNFRDWIRNRISDFGFIENQDFVCIAKNLAKPQGGRPSVEYFISINMAKELCMVERNELGRKWRAHFIKCEKDLMEIKRQQAIAVPQTLPEALRLAADLAEKNQKLLEEQKINAPKVDYCDQIVADNGAMTITKAAKVIGYPPRKFKDYIRQVGWLYANADTPMQHVITSGYMVLRYAHWTDNDGNYVEKPYAHITAKGMFVLYQRMRKEGLIEKNEQLELAA